MFTDNCDLNLRIQDDGLKACPLTVEGFAFMWAGARSMYGVRSGKVAYEAKVGASFNTFFYSERTYKCFQFVDKIF